MPTVLMKNAHCHSGGKASPWPGAGAPRVAAMRAAWPGSMASAMRSPLPIQAVGSLVVIPMSSGGFFHSLKHARKPFPL